MACTLYSNFSASENYDTLFKPKSKKGPGVHGTDRTAFRCIINFEKDEKTEYLSKWQTDREGLLSIFATENTKNLLLIFPLNTSSSTSLDWSVE